MKLNDEDLDEYWEPTGYGRTVSAVMAAFNRTRIFESFEQAVRSQVDDPATVHINGTYRGEPAIINYNPNTGLAVIQKPSGEFVSGRRLNR